MPRILVADDHAVARRGIKEILLEKFPLAEIITVANAEELMNMLVKEDWNLVITDITMPGRSGMEVLHDINQQFPALPVLILSVHPEREYAVRVIKSGAAGYLNKDEAIEEELNRAVGMALDGKKYITQTVAEMLARELSNDTEKLLHELLSNRELDVFKLLAQGRSTGEIARQLSLSVNTIGTFRSRILAKMNMKNNAEIVAYAIKHNL